MRPIRSILVLGVLLLIPAVAPAQLRFTQPSVDLGELRGGPAYDHRFDFVNASKEPIEITDVRLGCGCLRSVLPKRVFAAGEQGSLTLKLRTLGQPDGVRSWQAFVQYRQGAELREITLVMGAAIRNEITIEPSIIAMSVETALKQEFTITDHRKEPSNVKGVLASSPAIRISAGPSVNGVTRVLLEVRAADLTAARQEETLGIYLDDPFYRQLEVPITLVKMVRPSVTASPERIAIGCPGSQLVRLRGNGEKPIRIEKAEANQPGIRCTWAAGPGNDATLKISADATANSITAARVVIHFAEPAGATLAIPVELRKD